MSPSGSWNCAAAAITTGSSTARRERCGLPPGWKGTRAGVILDLETTLPGVQFYSSNYLDGCPAGKGGARYARRMRCAWRPSSYPDSPNHPDFPSCVLRPGETWDHTTVLRFSHR